MNAQTLLKQLDFIGAVISKKPIVPILEYALVDNGQLIGSNLRTTLICNTEIEGTFLIPFHSLRKVVSILPKDVECAFVFEEAYERVVLKTSNGTFTFNDIPIVGDFPKLPTRQETELGVLNTLDLHRIAAALEFSALDELRPAMCGVFIHEHVVATDGHRLAWFDYSGVVKEKPLLIDRLTASVLSTLGKASVRFDGNHIAEFHNDNGHAIITQLIDERFPNYKLTIPAEFDTKVIIARDALLTGISLGIQMANKTTRQILFEFSNKNGLTISTKDLDFDTKFEYTIPCIVKGPDIIIGFDGVFLKSILGAINTEEVTIKLTKPNKSGVVNDSFLLMPIMITEYSFA